MGQIPFDMARGLLASPIAVLLSSRGGGERGGVAPFTRIVEALDLTP